MPRKHPQRRKPIDKTTVWLPWSTNNLARFLTRGVPMQTAESDKHDKNLGFRDPPEGPVGRGVV
eukprot:11214058-Lingulodinium_polyedra.AAC.1